MMEIEGGRDGERVRKKERMVVKETVTSPCWGLSFPLPPPLPPSCLTIIYWVSFKPPSSFIEDVFPFAPPPFPFLSDYYLLVFF